MRNPLFKLIKRPAFESMAVLNVILMASLKAKPKVT